MSKSIVAAGVVALLAISSAQAAEWPQHGFYRVDQSQDGTCRFRTELRVDDKPVALIMVPHPGDRLMVQFLTTVPTVVDAPRLRIRVGSEDIVDVEPIESLPSPELPSFLAIIPNGSQVLAKLNHGAHAGGAMRLTAMPFDETLPSAGLPAALDDLNACLAGGSATQMLDLP